MFIYIYKQKNTNSYLASIFWQQYLFFDEMIHNILTQAE